MKLVEFGLGVEEVHLGWAAFHEDEDAGFGFGSEMRRAWSEGIGRRGWIGAYDAIGGEQGAQGGQADAGGGGGQEVAASEEDVAIEGIHCTI